jgi:hypothetical protein
MIDQVVEVAGTVTRMTYARVRASADGSTHFQDVAVGMAPAEYVPGIPLVDVAAVQPVTGLWFSRLDAGYTSDWHHRVGSSS